MWCHSCPPPPASYATAVYCTYVMQSSHVLNVNRKYRKAKIVEQINDALSRSLTSLPEAALCNMLLYLGRLLNASWKIYMENMVIYCCSGQRTNYWSFKLNKPFINVKRTKILFNSLFLSRPIFLLNCALATVMMTNWH